MDHRIVKPVPEPLTGARGARNHLHPVFLLPQCQDGKAQPDMGLQGLGKVVGLAPFSQRELVRCALGGTGQPVQRNRGIGLFFHGPLVHYPLEALDLLGLRSTLSPISKTVDSMVSTMFSTAL